MSKRKRGLRYPEEGRGWFASRSTSGYVMGPTEPAGPGSPHLTVIRKGDTLSRHVTREIAGRKEHVRLGELSEEERQFIFEFVSVRLQRMVPDDEVFVSTESIGRELNRDPTGFWPVGGYQPRELMAMIEGFDPSDSQAWVRVKISALTPGGLPGLQFDRRGAPILVARLRSNKVFRCSRADLLGRIAELWRVIGISGFFEVSERWAAEHG